MAHLGRGHTISNLCGFTERQIKFQRFFSVFVLTGAKSIAMFMVAFACVIVRSFVVQCVRSCTVSHVAFCLDFRVRSSKCTCHVKIAQEVRGVNCMFFPDLGLIRFRGFHFLLFTM